MDAGFSQIYIHDPDIQTRQRAGLLGGLDPEIISSLQDMLQQCNPFVRVYHVADERLASDPDDQFEIRMHSCRDQSRDHYGQYLQPASAEIAAIVPRSSGYEVNAYRDIIVQSQEGGLLRINEQHPLYDPLHYVLIFPDGRQGWMATLPSRGGRNDQNNGCKLFHIFFAALAGSHGNLKHLLETTTTKTALHRCVFTHS